MDSSCDKVNGRPAANRNILHLPMDVLQHVSHYLHARDVISLSRVCKLLRDVASSPKVWANLVQRSFLFEELPQDIGFLQSHHMPHIRAQFWQLTRQRPAFLSDAPRTSEILEHTGSRFRKVLHVDGRRDFNFTTAFRDVPPGHYQVVWRLMLQPGYVRGYCNFRAVFSRPADPATTTMATGQDTRKTRPISRSSRPRSAAAAAAAMAAVATATAAKLRLLCRRKPGRENEEVEPKLEDGGAQAAPRCEGEGRNNNGSGRRNPFTGTGTGRLSGALVWAPTAGRRHCQLGGCSATMPVLEDDGDPMKAGSERLDEEEGEEEALWGPAVTAAAAVGVREVEDSGVSVAAAAAVTNHGKRRRQRTLMSPSWRWWWSSSCGAGGGAGSVAADGADVLPAPGAYSSRSRRSSSKGGGDGGDGSGGQSSGASAASIVRPLPAASTRVLSGGTVGRMSEPPQYVSSYSDVIQQVDVDPPGLVHVPRCLDQRVVQEQWKALSPLQPQQQQPLLQHSMEPQAPGAATPRIQYPEIEPEVQTLLLSQPAPAGPAPQRLPPAPEGQSGPPPHSAAQVTAAAVADAAVAADPQQLLLHRAMNHLTTAAAKRDAALAGVGGGDGPRYVPRWLAPLWGSCTSSWRQLNPGGPLGYGTWRSLHVGSLTVRRQADAHLHGVLVQLCPINAAQQEAAFPPGATCWRGVLVDYVELVPVRRGKLLGGLVSATGCLQQGKLPVIPEDSEQSVLVVPKL